MNRTIEAEALRRFFGQTVALVDWIIHEASKQDKRLFLVGGPVRDLIMRRATNDIDFSLQGDARPFVHHLAAQAGGTVTTHDAFQTATWHLDAGIAEQFCIKLQDLPTHFDFVTSRRETYEHPAALPTVAPGTLYEDLARRDFTVNAMALQLLPQAAHHELHDPHHGRADLDAAVIRILHPQSFIDDPTRIFRALRFAYRLGFTIEPRTDHLLQQAIPYIDDLTPARVRHEIEALLGEENPADALLAMQGRGILAQIDTNWMLPAQRTHAFANENRAPAWTQDREFVRWHLICADLSADQIANLSERLMLSKSLRTALQSFVNVLSQRQLLDKPEAKPSQIDALLAELQASGLQACWIMLDSQRARERIVRYHNEWRHIQPTINGSDLIAHGLTPGPHFKTILQRLRSLWLDGVIRTTQDEASILRTLIEELPDDDV